MECKHADISGCAGGCECICDTCHQAFTENWDLTVKRFSLCPKCGVPLVLTTESLLEHQYMHFFDPCDDCEERFLISMAVARLCEVCHSHMDACKCK